MKLPPPLCDSYIYASRCACARTSIKSCYCDSLHEHSCYLSSPLLLTNSVLALQGEIVHDPHNGNITYCVYDSDIATGYGVGAFLFLFSSQSLLMSVTKCMCFGRPLAPGSNRAWSIIYFASSW